MKKFACCSFLVLIGLSMVLSACGAPATGGELSPRRLSNGRAGSPATKPRRQYLPSLSAWQS